VDVDEVISVADSVLKESPEIEIERIFDEEKDRAFKSEITAKMQVAKPLFDIGIKDNRISKDPIERLKKAAGMSVLNEMLFSKSSTLFNELYDEGLISGNFDYCYTVSSGFAFNEISGESSDPQRVYARVREYIAEKQRTGLDRAVYDRCKKVIFADFIKTFDSTEEIACELMSYIFEDCDMFDYADVIKALTFEDVEDLLSTMFDDSFFAISTVYPLD
jgi:predicted Zn-dependent peptidase